MAGVTKVKFMFMIGQDMNILPETDETDAHYIERVILSAVAKWMLTAVHNKDGKVSINNIKKTAQEKIDNFLEIVKPQSLPDVQTVVNCLYETLLENGMFYHEQYNVHPVRNREIGMEGVSFIRGLLPEENVCFSGMAPFIPGRGNADLADEFMLWKRNGEETIRSVWKHSRPQAGQIVISEFLRVDHQIYQKYYDTRRHDQAEFTIGRTRKSDANGFEYYLIRGNEIRRLTDDYVHASVHTYVALAIVNGQKRQNVLAKVGRNLVELEVSYLLPRPDARFLRFVSWPDSLQSVTSSRFKVNLHPKMWPVVKNRLKFLGFEVEEQNE